MHASRRSRRVSSRGTSPGPSASRYPTSLASWSTGPMRTTPSPVLARCEVGRGPATGALRSLKDPTSVGHPDRMSSLLYTADAKERDSGGIHTNSGSATTRAHLAAVGTEWLVQRACHRRHRERQDRGGLAHRASIYLLSGATTLTSRMPSRLLRKSHRRPDAILGHHRSDCQQVAEAVTATEMRQDLRPPRPRRAGRPRAGWAITVQLDR
jgi:hypothetical protein